MGGTLSAGYETSTGAKDGNQFGIKYAMSLDSASVTAKHQLTWIANQQTQTDVAVSYPLGGGVSVFGEMRTVSGDATGTDSSTTSTHCNWIINRFLI